MGWYRKETAPLQVHRRLRCIQCFNLLISLHWNMIDRYFPLAILHLKLPSVILPYFVHWETSWCSFTCECGNTIHPLLPTHEASVTTLRQQLLFGTYEVILLLHRALWEPLYQQRFTHFFLFCFCFCFCFKSKIQFCFLQIPIEDLTKIDWQDFISWRVRYSMTCILKPTMYSILIFQFNLNRGWNIVRELGAICHAVHQLPVWE